MPKKSLSASFAKVLKQERVAKGLSQEQLAHRAGLHRTYIGLLERGLRTPTLDAGHAIASALGVSLSEMVRSAEKRPR